MAVDFNAVDFGEDGVDPDVVDAQLLYEFLTDGGGDLGEPPRAPYPGNPDPDEPVSTNPAAWRLNYEAGRLLGQGPSA